VNLHVKTLLTLAVLAVGVLLGATWGWAALTSPFPHTAATKVCYPTVVHAGDRVTPSQVTVSVFNASRRIGLAERTSVAFKDQGFGLGTVGNAPGKTVVHVAQIWTSDSHNPAVALVRSRLGLHAAIVKKRHSGPGVVVMVGPHFKKLAPGKSAVTVRKSASICVPPGG
jgi:hypothetical protein